MDPAPEVVLSRTAASEEVEALGWRYLLDCLVTSVVVGSLQDRGRHGVTVRDTRLAAAVSGVVGRDGLATGGESRRELSRPVQMLELAIDAMDIAAIRPFWQAVLAAEDERGVGGPDDGLADPAGQLPTVWFQQMDAPRTQRNRIHFDVTVAHDEAEGRVAAALAAGGHLVSAAEARAFWILADAEGNEICVCTWQDRDGGHGR